MTSPDSAPRFSIPLHAWPASSDNPIKTINWGEKKDPNDFYDAMQLLLLEEGRLFVTNEKNFLRHTKDSYVERILPWEAFKKLPA